jgi:SOS response regulatory protein OraA/RecX
MLEKRLKGQNPHDLSYEDRQKLFAYMYRKGFAYDACSKAFDELSQIP